MNTKRTDSMHSNRVPKRFLIEAALLAVLALTISLPWGCSREQHTTGPTWNNTFELPNNVTAYPGTLSDEIAVSTVAPTKIPLDDPDLVITSVEIVVGLLGGVVTMVLSENESAFLTVPAGALLSNENIKADVSREPLGMDRRSTQFTFEPDGLVFRLPALLTIKSVEPEGTTLDLEWWDPSRNQWVQSAQAVVILGHATFPVLHFSDYRVTERISLGGQQNKK